MLSPPANITPATPETVLVVEDEVLIRMPIPQYLRDCGYRVLEAANADEAVIIMQKPEIQIDMVLCGIQMPGAMNGFGFAKWARIQRPGLAVILAGTASSAANAAAELCEDGPMFTKPYEPQIVLDHIKRVLSCAWASGRELSEGLSHTRPERAPAVLSR